jgi:hypothetical protein
MINSIKNGFLEDYFYKHIAVLVLPQINAPGESTETRSWRHQHKATRPWHGCFSGMVPMSTPRVESMETRSMLTEA